MQRKSRKAVLENRFMPSLSTTSKPISLSGIKPTHSPHIGNYLGMIRPAIELQSTHNTYYFIADLHALTSVRDPEKLKRDVREIAAIFLASGFDPSNGALYKQSDVPEVSELSWLLSCAVSMGDLTRAHAYKAAKDKGEEGQLSLGTFAYPVLMTADILSVNADVVPVGKDQVQHLEMARAIARRFNFHFGETFREPQELVREDVAIVPGVDGRKMSKSYQNGIDPFLDAKSVKKQVMAIVTDSKGLEDTKDPTNDNVVALYKLFATKEKIQQIEEKYRAGGYGYGHAKLALLEEIEAHFSPLREKYNEYLNNNDYLDQVLNNGAEKTREIASRILSQAQKNCGLR